MEESRELTELLSMSRRLGNNRLLVQAATGNVSLKVRDVLWIKASGKWLAHAHDETIMVPTSINIIQSLLKQGLDSADSCVIGSSSSLRPSVETAMHAVIPERVVVHVHSINAIAWAVRQDGEREIASLLEGLRWAWIPCKPSGVPLARAVEQALTGSRGVNVFVLANHGIVIAGPDCMTAEALLEEVEKRIAIRPRTVPSPDLAALEVLAIATGMHPAAEAVVHGLATDKVSCISASNGVLYPCQAIFLCPELPRVPLNEMYRAKAIDQPFLVVEDVGVLINDRLSSTAAATLIGLAEVVSRIPGEAPIRYLTLKEIRALNCADVHRYRELAEDGAALTQTVRLPRMSRHAT